MKRPISPCAKDCPRRTSTCHGDCPEYLKFFAEQQQWVTACQKDTHNRYVAYTMELESRERYERKNGKKRRI